MSAGPMQKSGLLELLPKELKGMTILIVGSDVAGLAEIGRQRGASQTRILSVSDCDSLEQSGELLDSTTGMAVGHVYDIVICLGVLERTINPLQLLDKLIQLTRNKLIIDIPQLGKQQQKKLALSKFKSMLLGSLPAIYVNATPRTEGPLWFPTVTAMTALLLRQRAYFSGLDVAPLAEDRIVFVAHKRHIGRLVVIAGPTSAGKSTLIRELQSDRSPAVAERLQIGDISTWQISGLRDIARSNVRNFDRLLIHCDFLGPSGQNSRGYFNTIADDVVQCAEHVSVLTIWQSPEQLQRQFEKSEFSGTGRVRIAQLQRAKHRQLREDYKRPAKIVQFYRNWLQFAGRVAADNYIADFTKSPIAFLSTEEWEQQHAARHSTSLKGDIR